MPKPARESAGIRPGQEVAVFNYRGRIEVVPMEPVKKMRGFLRGVNSDSEFREARSPGDPGFRLQVSGISKNVRWRVPEKMPNAFEATYFCGEGRVGET